MARDGGGQGWCEKGKQKSPWKWMLELRERSPSWGKSFNLDGEEMEGTRETRMTEQAGFGESMSTWSCLSDDMYLYKLL